MHWVLRHSFTRAFLLTSVIFAGAGQGFAAINRLDQFEAAATTRQAGHQMHILSCSLAGKVDRTAAFEILVCRSGGKISNTNRRCARAVGRRSVEQAPPDENWQTAAIKGQMRRGLSAATTVTMDLGALLKNPKCSKGKKTARKSLSIMVVSRLVTRRKTEKTRITVVAPPPAETVEERARILARGAGTVASLATSVKFADRKT